MSEIKENNPTPETGRSRRNFFKISGMAAAGTAFGLSLPETALAAKMPRYNPKNGGRGYWKWVQNQFILDPKIVPQMSEKK